MPVRHNLNSVLINDFEEHVVTMQLVSSLSQEVLQWKEKQPMRFLSWYARKGRVINYVGRSSLYVSKNGNKRRLVPAIKHWASYAYFLESNISIANKPILDEKTNLYGMNEQKSEQSN